MNFIKRNDIDYNITTDRKVIQTSSDNIIKILLTHTNTEFYLLNKILSIKDIGNFFIIPQKVLHIPKSEITILKFLKFKLQSVNSPIVFFKYSMLLFNYLKQISLKLPNLDVYKTIYIEEIETLQQQIKKIDLMLENLSKFYLNRHKNNKIFSIIFSSFHINNFYYNCTLKKYQFTDIDSIKVGRKEFDLFNILANYMKLLYFDENLINSNVIIKKLIKAVDSNLFIYPLLRPLIDFNSPQFDPTYLIYNIKTFLIINKIKKNNLKKDIKKILYILNKLIISLKIPNT